MSDETKMIREQSYETAEALLTAIRATVTGKLPAASVIRDCAEAYATVAGAMPPTPKQESSRVTVR